MQNSDPLLRLLVDFFDLPADKRHDAITQQAVPAWDSLAMVQLIAELEGIFLIEFDLEEIQRLRSYDEIHAVLQRKGVLV